MYNTASKQRKWKEEKHDLKGKFTVLDLGGGAISNNGKTQGMTDQMK